MNFHDGIHSQGSVAILSGAKFQAVRYPHSHYWLVTRGLMEGSLSNTVQLLLLDSVDMRDSNTIPVTQGRSLEIPAFSRWLLVVAEVLIFVCFFIISMIVDTKDQLPGEAARLLIGGVIITYLCQFFMEALALRSSIGGTEPIVKLTARGLKIDRVVWVLVESKKILLFTIIIPFAFAVYGFWGDVPVWYAWGIIGFSILRLMARTCPLLYGPVSSLLGLSSGVRDYAKYLRMSLASRFLFAQRFHGARISLGWAISCLFAFAVMHAIVNPSNQLEYALMRTWDFLGLLFVGWCFYTLVRMAKDAMRLKKKNVTPIAMPDTNFVRKWKEGCALLVHAPGLTGAHWDWIAVEAGCPLIRFGQMEAAFWWVASGSLEKWGRNYKGLENPEGLVRAGSAFASGLFKEQLVSSTEWIAMEPSVVCRLSASWLDTLDEESRTKALRFIQISNSFDRNAELAGLHPVLKEIWLSKGRLVWIPGGTVIMEAEEDAAWMGLLVQGSLRVDGTEEAIVSDSLVGAEILAGVARRQHTVVTNVPCMIMRWESNWLYQWIPQRPQEAPHFHERIGFQHG